MGNNSSSHQAVVGQLIGQSLEYHQAVIRQSSGSKLSSSISTSTKEWRVGLVFPISYLDGGFNKGPFIYYVITFLGFLDPPPPLRNHVFSTENNQKLTQSFTEEKKGLNFSPSSALMWIFFHHLWLLKFVCLYQRLKIKKPR